LSDDHLTRGKKKMEKTTARRRRNQKEDSKKEGIRGKQITKALQYQTTWGERKAPLGFNGGKTH